jgi:hypothetical protein
MDELVSAAKSLGDASQQLGAATVKLIGSRGFEEAQRLLSHIRQIEEQKAAVEQTLARFQKAAAPAPAPAPKPT